jgi:integrase
MSKARRGKGEGSIDRVTLASGKVAWRGWLTVGYKRDAAGKRRAIRRTVQRATRRAVLEGLERLRAKYRGGMDFAAETQLRHQELLEKWLAHVQATRTLKQHTPDTYRWAIAQARAFGNPLVAQVQDEALQAFLVGLDLGTSSVKLVRYVLRGAYALAQRWKVRPDNPAEHLEMPRARPVAERRVITADEARAYLRALERERLGLAVALTYAVAMRPGEAAALRMQDVDLERRTIRVEGSHNRIPSTKTIEREPPKSARGVRELRLPEPLVPWMQRRLARVEIEWSTMEGQWTAPNEGLLFVREQTGGRIERNDIYNVARRVAKRVGLDGISPRVLRRSMLTELARRGVDRKVRAAIGGHTEIITETHYREVPDDEVAEAMGFMDAVLDDEITPNA